MVRRVDGSVHHAEIHTVAGRPSQKIFNFEWALNLLQLLPPIICLLIGYWVVAARIRDSKSVEFVNDMCGRLAWDGREPTERQGKWLISIFLQLGGRVA